MYGFYATVPDVYRGAKFGQFVVGLMFIRPEFHGLKISEAFFANGFLVRKKVIGFDGHLNEQSASNAAVEGKIKAH